MHVDEYRKQRSLEDEYWWWVGRRELVLHQLQSRIRGRARILDVGCGTGGNLQRLTDLGTAVGVDFSRDALRLCDRGEGTRVIEGDARNLPFDCCVFDAAVALDVLEHLDEDRRAVEEIARVLKPGGTLLLSVPALPFLWSQHDESLGHRRRYTRRRLLQLLDAAGMTAGRAHYWNALALPSVALVRKSRALQRRPKPTSDPGRLPRPINQVLLGVIRTENALFSRGFRSPLGVSLLAVCEKPKRVP